MLRLSYCIAAALFAGFIASAKADTATLRAVADDCLFEFAPGNNMGRETTVAAGTIGPSGGNKRSRALFRFDLSSIPANATVTAARFTVRVTKQPSGAAASNFDLRKVLAAWNEGTKLGTQGATAANGEVTWTSRIKGTANWTTAGGAVGTDFSSTVSAVTRVSSPASYAFTANSAASTAQMIADVQGWVSSPASNFGWVLMSEAESTSKTARRFATREDGTVANRPTLDITYTVAAATAPSITTQPQSQSVPENGSVTLTVVASGTAPLSYQWARNGTDISGATSSSLTINNFSSANEGTYAVKVSNSAGSATSSGAVLTLAATAPSITAQPQSQSVAAGAGVTLGVTVTGTAPLSYQWARNGVDIAGATTATLTINNFSAANEGTYAVKVSNSVGSTNSSGAVLTLSASPPVITTQPQSQTVAAGGTATLTVVASGTGPLSYQWARGGVDLAGATGATLTITNFSAANEGTYAVKVSNNAGSATSSGAVLTLAAPLKISQASASGGTFTLGFHGDAGFDYAVEFRNSLTAGTAWQTLTNFNAKLAPVDAVVKDPISGQQRYYRVEATPIR